MEPETKDIELRQQLLSMGFQQVLVMQAIQYSSDKDTAIQFIISTLQDMDRLGISHNQTNKNQAAITQTNQVKEDNEDDNQYQDLEQYCKMVFLVRMDLKMGLGKMAAQVGHATIGAYKKIQKLSQINEDAQIMLLDWMECGSKKIALRVETQAEILQLVQKARQSKINFYLVHDAGRTQIAAGSLTVCALGPDREEVINKVTGHLKLL